MDTENDAPTVTVEIEAPASPPSEGEEAAAEEVAEVVAEAIEEVSSDAVEIARIEADRDITVEAIHADTATALAETAAEVETARIEERSWQETIETNMQELRQQLADLRSALPSSQETLTEAALETAAEVEAVPINPETTSPSILPDISEPIERTETEVIAENESGAEATVTVRRRRRAI